MQFTTSITVASLLAFTYARPAPPVQAVPAFPNEAVAKDTKLNWIHVSAHIIPEPCQNFSTSMDGGHYLIPMDRLVYALIRGKIPWGLVSVQEINYADGSGNPVPGGVVECRVFKDAYGLVQYGEAFSDAGGGSYPYALDDGKGVDVKTILCSDKGTRTRLVDETTGNTNTTSPACTK